MRDSHAFARFAEFAALPRLSGLALSPDGTRLVTSAAVLDDAGAAYVTHLWEVDPTGARAARRLTYDAAGAGDPVFTAGGDLLFTSTRAASTRASSPDDADVEPVPSLWCLPAGGGEAHLVAGRPGGVRSAVTAAAADVVALASAMLPSATDDTDDARRRAARRTTKTSGVLYSDARLRLWDHDLGPDALRLLAGPVAGQVAPDAPTSPQGSAHGSAQLADLTGHVGAALDDDSTWALTPDGRTLVSTWTVLEGHGDLRRTVVAVDVATGERRRLADDDADEHDHPLVSPDGGRVALVRSRRPTPAGPGDAHLLLVDLATGEQRPLAADWDRWPTPLAWTPDGGGLIVVADDGGRAPLFHLDATTGARTRLTADDGAYTDARVSPDGAWVYALRSAVDAPPAPVRLPLRAAGAAAGPAAGPGAGASAAEAQALPGPAHALDSVIGAEQLPGLLTEVAATAADGTALRAWLAIPDTAGAEHPAPLLLWVHGGPLHSWNAWSWRWNPWLAVAQGYAVLLPDPALSTGYGIDFIKRGWGAWGQAPFTDLMTITDAALAREDVDARRTAALGGSFGGYMANWIAGHTERFRAIVTHASLWALDQFATTTDMPAYWARTMSGAAAQANSPHHFAGAITTPLLVVHGDRDDRVPIGEALRLWTDLTSRTPDAGSGRHRFLYFPDENHWILGPGNAALWYETVFAFLAVHVLGQEWSAPEALG